MIIGYLVPGILVALVSALVALLSGYGVLAAFGFYVLGGSLATIATVCASLFCHLARKPEPYAVEA